MNDRIVRLIIALSLCVAASCTPKDGNNQKSASGAQQAAPYRVPKNAHGYTVEQQNIIDRQTVTTDPTKVMWIHLIGLDGKIISRMSVRNKVTSSSKRLEPTKAVIDPSGSRGSFPSYDGRFVDEMIQPDGTYGSSDSYVYWFDPMGRYHQWGTAGGLGYLVTDYPIDLENPIEKVSGMYNADKVAQQWQAEQEARMKGRPTSAPAESGSTK